MVVSEGIPLWWKRQEDDMSSYCEVSVGVLVYKVANNIIAANVM